MCGLPELAFGARWFYEPLALAAQIKTSIFDNLKKTFSIQAFAN
jgi:hypothetical protein